MTTRQAGVEKWFAMGLALAATSAVATAAIDLRWSTVDGGGGQGSAGGGFVLSATIGQPDAGPALVGGTFALSGGFWGGAAPGCASDINSDGVVDLDDLSQLLVNFGVAAGATFEDGDIDGDGDVDLIDLSMMLTEFGASCN